HRPGALGRAAMAGPDLLESGGVRLVQDDPVVVGQFLARLDRADRLDEDLRLFRMVLVLLQHRLAVRVATGIEPAGAVAAMVGVDDVFVVEGEQEGVAALDVPALLVVHLLVGPALALVLDDALAPGDGEQGENAVAMDPGLAGGDFAGHCFSHAWINGHCGPDPVTPSYSTISVLLDRAPLSAARHPPDRLRHRRTDRARRAHPGRAQRSRTGRGLGPGSADRGQGPQAAGAGRAGRGFPRRRRRLPPAPQSRRHQPGRDRGSDGRPAGHDRMQPACGQLRDRTVLRRARQLAPHQRRGRARPARRDPGPDGRGSMSNATENAEILEQLGRRYDAGFVTDIESDSLPPGLDEGTIRALSARKDEPEWMTEWRLAAFRHWLTMPV